MYSQIIIVVQPNFHRVACGRQIAERSRRTRRLRATPRPFQRRGALPDCESTSDDAEALLGAADAAMYRAEQSGRNRYHFSPELANALGRHGIGTHEQGNLVRDWRVLDLGVVSDLLEMAPRRQRTTVAQSSLRLGFSHAERGHCPCASMDDFRCGGAGAACRRRVFRRCRADRRQLAGIHLGGQRRLRHRDKPGLLYRSPGQYTDGRDFPARTPALVAMGLRWAGDDGCSLSDLRLWCRPLDRPYAGLYLRRLWTDQKDCAARVAPWPDA